MHQDSIDKTIAIRDWCPIAAFAASMGSTLPQPGHPNNISMNVTRLNGGAAQVCGITCAPSSALYTANFIYHADVRTVSHSAKYTGSLNGRMKGSQGTKILNVPGKPSVSDAVFAYNHFAVIAALMESLQGNHTMTTRGIFAYGLGGGGDEIQYACCKS
jgi:hypothetical protein